MKPFPCIQWDLKSQANGNPKAMVLGDEMRKKSKDRRYCEERRDSQRPNQQDTRLADDDDGEPSGTVDEGEK